MEVAGNSYPLRTSIRYKAREQLKLELDAYNSFEAIDEKLFVEITTTLFAAQKFDQPLSSWEEAAREEDRIASELVETYLHIKSRRSDSIVQKLNALL